MKNLKKSGLIKKLWGVMFVMAVMVSSGTLVPVKDIPVIMVQAVENTISSNLLIDSIQYTAFGDSIATGFGLSGYQAGELHSAVDAYREKIAKKLKKQYPDAEILTDSLAIDGMNSTQLLEYLTNPDNERYEEFRKAAEKSDVITLSIGSNDILGLFTKEVAKELNCDIEEIGSVLNSAVKSGDLRSLVSLLQSARRLNKSLAGLPEDMEEEEAVQLISSGAITGKAEFNQACEKFAENLQKILETIRTLSPDTVIYVTNIYNPYKDIVLRNPIDNTCVLDMGSLAEFYINKLNQAFTENIGKYQLIDVKAAFDSCKKVPVNANITGNNEDFTLENYNVDPHPTAEGHTMIASLIKEKIEESPVMKRKLLPIGKTKFTAGNFHCTLTSFDGVSGEVMIRKAIKSVKKVVIPDIVISGDKEIPVTAIKKKAWKGDKKIVSLLIGKNVRTIGKRAFYQCKNLKNITVQSENITKLGTQAWKKIHKEAVFKFPEKCKKKYKKLF